MTKFTRTFITSLVFVASAGMAHASDASFKTTMTIDKTASAQAAYASLEAQARLACRKEVSRSGYTLSTVPQKFLKDCKAQVLENAVNKSNNRILLALHGEKTGQENTRISFAKK